MALIESVASAQTAHLSYTMQVVQVTTQRHQIKKATYVDMVLLIGMPFVIFHYNKKISFVSSFELFRLILQM